MSKLVNQCWALCPGFRQVIPKFWINSECVSRNSGPQFMSWNQRGRITRQLPKPKNEVWGETWQKPRPKTRACHTGWWRLGDKIKNRGNILASRGGGWEQISIRRSRRGTRTEWHVWRRIQKGRPKSRPQSSMPRFQIYLVSNSYWTGILFEK